MRLRQPCAQRLHLLADVFVIAALALDHSLIIFDNAEAAYSQCLFNIREIVGEQLTENFKVMLRQYIDATLTCAHLFTSDGKGILTAYQKIGQIVMPKIFVKAINCSDIQQSVYLLINVSDQLLTQIIAAVQLQTNVCQSLQQIILRQIAVNKQLRN